MKQSLYETCPPSSRRIFHKKMSWLKWSVGLALLGLTQTAFALGANSFSSTLPPGSTVMGTAYCACSDTGDLFATTTDLTELENNLSSAILADGKVWTNAQNQQMAANLKERNQYLQEQAQFQKELDAAKSEEHIQTQIGNWTTTETLPNGTSVTIPINQTTASCSSQTNRKDALGQGLIANAALASNLGQALAGYNVSNTSNMATLNNLAKAPPSTLTAASIFPTASTGGTSNYPTPEEAATAIAHMTNPLPPAQLTAYQKKTASGTQWLAAQNASNAKMSMAQNALTQIAAWHQPTIEAQTFVAQWDAMMKDSQSSSSSSSNNTVPPAPGVNAQGKISPDGALDLAIDARYSNPKWYAQVALQVPSGLYKDLNEMGAIGLRVHYEEMITSEYMAGVSAEEYAHMAVSPVEKQMNNLAGNAMEQQMNQPSSSAPSTPSGS